MSFGCRQPAGAGTTCSSASSSAAVSLANILSPPFGSPITWSAAARQTDWLIVALLTLVEGHPAVPRTCLDNALLNRGEPPSLKWLDLLIAGVARGSALQVVHDPPVMKI